MLLLIKDWEKIREHFSEMEKQMLNESIEGETLCPRGCIIKEDTSVAVKIKQLLRNIE
jgi:hypothetical protein